MIFLDVSKHFYKPFFLSRTTGINTSRVGGQKLLSKEDQRNIFQNVSSPGANRNRKEQKTYNYFILSNNLQYNSIIHYNIMCVVKS